MAILKKCDCGSFFVKGWIVGLNCFNKEDFLNDFDNSRKILIGIGESFQIKLNELEQIPLFIQKRDELRTVADGEWYYPFLIRYFLKPFFHVKKEKTYRKLIHALEGRDFFLVNLTTDDFLENLNLDEAVKDRMVSPCGSYEILQCPDGCGEDLYLVPEDFAEHFQSWVEGKTDSLPKKLSCGACGKELVFNQANEPHYLEKRYLGQWNQYRKWLQETMNDTLMMVELGAGMVYPSVIRWPWEKISMYQLKSKFYRVNGQFYQLPEKVNENAHPVMMDPELFIETVWNE